MEQIELYFGQMLEKYRAMLDQILSIKFKSSLVVKTKVNKDVGTDSNNFHGSKDGNYFNKINCYLFLEIMLKRFTFAMFN